MNLTSTEQNAAQAQVQALQSVTQAQQGVQEATYNLSEANYGLGQAYVSAREAIVSANNALADAKLNVQSATLAVSQAEYNQLQVDQNAYSTDLDRQQASLAVAQAKQQVKDATASETDSQTAANLANKQGVAGSQTVIQAKQAQKAAVYSLKDANQSYSDAQKNLTLTEANNARQVKEAQLQASQAQEQAAYQAKMDAQAVSIAQQNVTNTIKEQKLEWKSMLSTENSAANQFTMYMSKLTPAGKGFVNGVLGLVPAFKGLETIAQNTVLPGMTVFLNGIKGLLPEVGKGVGEMGKAMSAAFGAFGKQMATPAFAKTLDGLIQNGLKFVNVVLPAFAGFAQQLAISGGKKGAVDGLASALAGIAHAMTGVVKAITPFEGPIDKVFGVLGKAVAAIGGPLGQVIGSLATALAPALQALLPGFVSLVDSLGSGLSAALIGAAPLLGAFARGITIMAKTFAPMLPQIGRLIGQLLTGLAPVLVALLPAVTNLAQVFANGLAAQLVQLGPVITQILPPLGNLVISFLPLVTAVTKVAALMTGWLDDMTGPLTSGLAFVIGHVVAFASKWHDLLHDVADVAIWLWHNVLDPMWQGIDKGANWLVGALPGVWGKIEDVFKTPVDFLINVVYDKGIRGFWNEIVGAVGLSTLDLPHIAPLAGGGVLPGYSPGHDTVPAMLSPGEAVLTPGAAKAVGHDTVNQLNASYPPSGGGGGGGIGKMAGKTAGKEVVRRAVERPALKAATFGKLAGGGIIQHFSPGGIVGDIGSFLGGAAHDIGSAVSGAYDAAKIGVDLATGNTTAVANALGQFMKTDASAANLAKVMIAIPTTLAGDLVKAITGAGGALPSGGSNALGSLPENWHTIATYLYGHGFSKMAAAGVAGNIDAESAGNPEAVEIGGGGGGGLIQWTPWQSYGPLITGSASQDLMTQLAAILSFNGGPSIVNRGTSPSNAAMIYQDEYERPKDRTASLGQRMSSANAVYKAMGWGSFDSGGWMPPGAPNFTGEPEAVLTPEQSQAFVRFVEHLTSGQSGGAAPGTPTVVQNYYGTQYPTVEQQAIQNRNLAMALSGG